MKFGLKLWWGCFSVIALAFCMVGFTWISSHDERVCEANMRRIWFAVKGSHAGRYAASLRDIAHKIDDKSVFLSNRDIPNAGSLTNVNDWTDFVYVGNISEGSDPRLVMLISPPENHQGKFSLILESSGVLKRVAPDFGVRLIHEPWLTVANHDPKFIKMMREQLKVEIPAKFRQKYAQSLEMSN